MRFHNKRNVPSERHLLFIYHISLPHCAGYGRSGIGMFAGGKIQQRLVKMPIYSLAAELTLPFPYHEPVSH